MIIYVFGNPDVPEDNSIYPVVEKLKNDFKDIQFIDIKPNEDLPFIDEKNVILLDTIQGIDEVTILTENDLDKLIVNRSTTAHDYDLGFQLKYLKKLGKLQKITIIGIPNGKSDYQTIKTILNNFKL